MAGRFQTTQCHQPLPVGASGSWTISAKLFVPAGAFRQLKAGDTLPPVQPKPLKTWADGDGLAGHQVGADEAEGGVLGVGGAEDEQKRGDDEAHEAVPCRSGFSRDRMPV